MTALGGKTSLLCQTIPTFSTVLALLAYFDILTIPIFCKRSGGGQAARGVDSAEEPSLGSRQGEELPLLEARIASVINSKTFRF